MEKTKITIEATINTPVEKTWKLWTGTEHIVKWNSASPEWHSPSAKHDLKVGGTFVYRMEAKDGSFGFDFGGTFDVVDPNKQLAYTMGDGRKADTRFKNDNGKTHITTTFEAEGMNPVEMQKAGWQAILNNFKNYAETH